MNARTAVRTVRTLNTTHDAHAEITRATRSTLNKALFAMGLPTLGNARTLDAYTVRLDTPDYVLLRDVCSGESLKDAQAYAQTIREQIAAA